jgi:hypothetical protein
LKPTGFLLLALLIGLVLPTVAQDTGATIVLPPSVVSGTVEVTGTVNPDGLQSYFLEVAPYDAAVADADARWSPASLPAREPVVNGVVATWQTTLLEDGLYRLRLRVALADGTQQVFVVGPIRVDNAAAPLLLATNTPAETQLPTPEPPTATPTIAPTPTVVPRPQVLNDLPVPVGGHIRDFNPAIVPTLHDAGLTWLKWQIPFTVGDDSLLAVARDRISWSHANGFLAMLSIKGSKDELGAMGADYYPLYAEFVRRVAEFQPDAIQVWNEMNLDREWPQGQIDPRMYVDLLRPAYAAIKSVDPSIRVITGAPAPTGAEGAFGLDRVWNDDRYYLGMANAGAADVSDCIGIHYNEGIIAPSQQGGDPRGNYPTYYFPLMLQRAAWPFRNIETSFCFSELGYLSPEGYGALPSGFAWAANTSIQEQAEWLRDAIQAAAQAQNMQIDLIIIWNLDFSNFEEDPQAGYAIFRADGACPACEAIRSLRAAP